MFADNITITIDGTAKTLVRINQDKYSSEYFLRETGGEFRMNIRHASYVNKTSGRRTDRHNAELIQIIYQDALGIPPLTRKAYFIFENEASETAAGPVQFTLGLMGFATETNLTKLVNWES